MESASCPNKRKQGILLLVVRAETIALLGSKGEVKMELQFSHWNLIFKKIIEEQCGQVYH